MMRIQIKCGVLLLTVFLFCNPFQAALGVTNVNLYHPRIWLTSDELSNLRTDCLTGKFSTMYPKVKEYIASSPSKNNYYQGMRYYLSLLVAGVVEPDIYLPGVVDGMYACASYVYGEYNPVVVALIYDWFYDDLTGTQKQDAADFLLAWMHEQDIDHIHGSWNNHTMEEIQGYIFGSLAMYGDGYHDGEAEAYLAVAENWLFDEAIAATNQAAGPYGQYDNFKSGGGWSESPEYCARNAFALWHGVWAWTTATDRNAFLESSALEGMGRFFIHITRPFDNTLMPYGDNSEIRLSYRHLWILNAMAKLYGDGVARYLWDGKFPTVDEHTWDAANAYGYGLYFLTYNDTPAVDPSTQPLAHLFGEGGMNLVTMRTGWNEDDTFFAIKFGDRFAGHGHLDVGHFELSKGGHLAIDAGAYEGGNTSPNKHGHKYYHRTIAHNSITVYDPNETPPSGWWICCSNDGGQRCYPETNGHPTRYGDVTDGSMWDTAELKAFEHTNDYTYVFGDASDAYARADGSDLSYTNSQKLSNFTRQVVFLRPDCFVIYDRVSSTDANFAKRWLLHSINEPQVSGNVIEQDPSAGATGYDGDETVITEGNGNLLVKTVFPDEHITTKRGGPGFEYWTNYDSSGENPTFDTQYWGNPPNEPGSWRIEVRPAVPALDETFLHVLYVGPDPMPEINGIMGSNVRGAQAEDWVAIFSDAESKIENGEFDITGSGIYHTIIADLEPNQIYYVSIDGNSETYASSSNGLLVFDMSLTGTHSVAISQGPPDTDPPAPPAGLAATADFTSVSLTWTANTEPDLAGYNVYRSTTSGSGYAKINTSLVSGTSYQDNDVEQGITYYYVLTAVDSSNNESGYSGEVSVAVLEDTDPPAAPTGLVATADFSSVDLTWTANTESDLAGYNVYKSTTSGGGYAKVSTSLVSGTSYQDSSVEQGITYYYVLTAVDSSNNESGYSDEVSVAIPVDAEPPAAPIGLAATADSSSVDLTWTANTESDLAGYNVYRSITSGSGYAKINTSLVSGISYQDTNVAQGITYYYVSTALDTSSNESGYSGEVGAALLNSSPIFSGSAGNVALKKTVSAIGQSLDGHPANYCNDGVVGQRLMAWVGIGTPNGVIIDLGGDYNINRIKVNPFGRGNNNYFYNQGWNVKCALSPDNWQDFTNVTKLAGAGTLLSPGISITDGDPGNRAPDAPYQFYEFAFDATTARYIRFYVTAGDEDGDSNCDEIEVYTVGGIPDQTWDENTQNVNAFDLDDYFSDPDGDLLTYTHTSLVHIVVIMDQDNQVSFDPEINWSGTESIVFTASDGRGGTADSNTITLTVLAGTTVLGQPGKPVHIDLP